MNKTQFLQQLDEALKPLSSSERADIARDFEEHFNVGFEEGKSEAEIAEGLGSPHKIAKELLATYHIEREEYQAPIDNSLRTILAAIGIGFFNLIIVLGPLMAIVGIVFAGWVVGVTFIATPLLILIGSVIFQGSFEFFDLFVSLALAGLGIFITMGMYYFTLFFSGLLRRYVNFNIDFVKGGGKRE